MAGGRRKRVFGERGGSATKPFLSRGEAWKSRLEDRGIAWIGGTKVKVTEAVLDKLASQALRPRASALSLAFYAARFDEDRLLERATELGRVLVSQDEDLCEKVFGDCARAKDSQASCTHTNFLAALAKAPDVEPDGNDRP